VASPGDLCIFDVKESLSEERITATYQERAPRWMCALVDVSWLPSDNGLLISTYELGQICLWDTSALTVADTLYMRHGIYAHAISPLNSVNLAVSGERAVTIVDLRSTASVQTLLNRNSQSKAHSLLWDAHNEFVLYGGFIDECVCKWDIRRPDKARSLCEMPSGGHATNVVSMRSVGCEYVCFMTKGGSFSLIDKADGQIIHRTEMEFTCHEGYKIEITEQTSDPLAILPSYDRLRAFNLKSGTEEWTKELFDIPDVDQAIYNHNRLELYLLPRNQTTAYVCGL